MIPALEWKSSICCPAEPIDCNSGSYLLKKHRTLQDICSVLWTSPAYSNCSCHVFHAAIRNDSMASHLVSQSKLWQWEQIFQSHCTENHWRRTQTALRTYGLFEDFPKGGGRKRCGHVLGLNRQLWEEALSADRRSLLFALPWDQGCHPLQFTTLEIVHQSRFAFIQPGSISAFCLR